jgi:Ras-related protein Rab-6A
MKAVLLGDCGVGKTAILSRVTVGEFRSSTAATAGGSYQLITVQSSDGRSATLQLWDTPGSESYRSLVPLYLRSSEVIILVYDLTQRDSFSYLDEWVSFCRNNGPEQARLILVGNKTDREADRSVGYGEGEQFARSIEARAFIETSAKMGYNMELLLQHVADEALLAQAAETGIRPTETRDLMEGANGSKAKCCTN